VFEYLEGVIAGRSAARVVIDVSGVGYEVCVPLSSRLADAGRVRVWTHLVVREDSHTLYGFEDRETRELFRVLLSVRGVGPVMALGILSGLPRAELIEAIAAGDVKALTRIRGVGKKTAEQILLDLRDKAEMLRRELAASRSPAAPLATSTARKNVDDAVVALVSIGYSEKEARKSVERAADKVDSKNLEELVRAALSS
jgi:Holliday junction DNA helicase RuvA